MSALATLTGRLTLPYRRGAEFLSIPLGADAAGATAFAPYDFAEYRARWGQDPAAPAYVIAPRQDVSGDDLTLTLDYIWNGAKQTKLTVPRATRARTGFSIPLAPGADATLRLTSLTVTPQVFSAGTVTTKAGGNTGNGICDKVGGTPTTPSTAVGNYAITMTDATHFTVTAPDGNAVGTGTTGKAFTTEIKFRIMSGTTPFVAGDGFIFPVLAIAGKDAWDVIALLGTIAKLAWLLGTEKETLACVRNDVRNMRFVDSAFGAGLDALGKDMSIPRFPPRPYSFDDATIALWHLDELPTGVPVTTVVDQTTRVGVAGHPGTVAGAVAGVPGKFGTGFAFFASSVTLTTNGPTAAANATLHFAAVPGTILPGMAITDLTTGAVISNGTTVASTTATTVVMSQNAAGAGVGSGDAIQFTTGSAITIASSADFDIAADADATIEAFVSTDIPSDAMPRTIVVRRATETATGSNTPGWSLCVVNARGFNANVFFALCDGVRETRIFADVGIADNRFHHVAGIVDRTRKRARLFVDGVQRATAAIDAIGTIAPPIDVRLGSTASGNGLSGTIDEVRISRVARTTFHPALGEEDEAYRARLRIFRRWVLPTPANVIAMVNAAAPLGNDPAPYVLVEANQPTQVAECPVRIVPATLAVGTAIALDGTTPQDETVAGTPDDDAGFDPSLDLITYVNASVDASTDPGGARMQAGTGKVLDALMARLATAGTPGKLILEHSYDTTGPTALHSVGRALRLHHQTLAIDVLGALAHRAGFAYVRNLGPNLAVAVTTGERLAIRSAPAVTQQRADVLSAFDLTIDPPLPLAGTFSWTINTPGPASAHFIAHSADLLALNTNGATAAANATLHFAAVPGTILRGMVIVNLSHPAVIPSGTTVVSVTAATVVMSLNATGAGVASGDTIQFSNPSNTPIASRPRVRLVTDSPGDLAVRVEYGRGGRTRSGTLSLRIDPTTLADGHALDTVGNLDPDSAAIVGTPDSGFDPAYLVTHAPSPAINFGADPNNSKMQVVARDALDALAALLAARATQGRLTVTQAFVPGGPGVESVGRRLVLGHETLDPGALGALASRYFDYVARTGASITAFMRPDTWIEIGDAVTTAPIPAEIILGTPLNLAVVPSATLTTNAGTAAANATLHFAAVPGTILPGMVIVDLTTQGVIPSSQAQAVTLITNGATAAANATLHFAAVPATIQPGMVIVDLSNGGVIPTGTTVASTTATTVVMSQSATGAGVVSGDTIQFITGTTVVSTTATTVVMSQNVTGAGVGSGDAIHFTNLNGPYNWSMRAIGAGKGSFNTLVRPNARFTPSKPGLLVLALTHVAPDDSLAAPYTFEIRLKAALDVPGTFIPKDQYDIIMNVLDAFHPIGVEVRTDHIRKHVREIEQDPTKAFPAYSFPNFRS